MNWGIFIKEITRHSLFNNSLVYFTIQAQGEALSKRKVQSRIWAAKQYFLKLSSRRPPKQGDRQICPFLQSHYYFINQWRVIKFMKVCKIIINHDSEVSCHVWGPFEWISLLVFTIVKFCHWDNFTFFRTDLISWNHPKSIQECLWFSKEVKWVCQLKNYIARQKVSFVGCRSHFEAFYVFYIFSDCLF